MQQDQHIFREGLAMEAAIYIQIYQYIYTFYIFVCYKYNVYIY